MRLIIASSNWVGPTLQEPRRYHRRYLGMDLDISGLEDTPYADRNSMPYAGARGASASITTRVATCIAIFSLGRTSNYDVIPLSRSILLDSLKKLTNISAGINLPSIRWEKESDIKTML